MIRLAIIAALAAGPASADRLSLMLGSHHVDGVGFEEINPGIIYTREGEALDLTAGVYRNSYGRTSVALTAGLPLVDWGWGEAGVFAGVAHYPQEGRLSPTHIGGDWMVIGGATVIAGPVFVNVLPSDGKATDAIIAFGLTWDF